MCDVSIPPGTSIRINLCFLRHYEGNIIIITSHASIITRALIYGTLSVVHIVESTLHMLPYSVLMTTL